MKKYAMVIDLNKCVGCGGCDLACKTENNTPDGITWANHFTETTGKFPNVQYEHIPTLCNHCDKPACARVCPTGAMYKDETTGMVLHDEEKCIGCKSCMLADPYRVIYYNSKKPHQQWKDSTELIKGCTASAKEIMDKTKNNPPHYNKERERTYAGVRSKGVVEKCTFCDHQVRLGKLPHCVVSCPADARIFGDLSDSSSDVSKLVKKYKAKRLLPGKGTFPNVYYIREYSNGG